MASESTGKARVLVVDDDRDTALYLSILLEDHGYEVRTAEDNAAALAALEDFEADLVILDVMMPGASGLALLVTLRSDPRWAELSVIVVTGNDSVLEDYGRSYLAVHEEMRGPDAVLGKPVDPEALLRLVES